MLYFVVGDSRAVPSRFAPAEQIIAAERFGTPVASTMSWVLRIITVLILSLVFTAPAMAAKRAPLTGWNGYSSFEENPKFELFETAYQAAVNKCALVGRGLLKLDGSAVYCTTAPGTEYFNGLVYQLWICQGSKLISMDNFTVCYDNPEKPPECPCHGNPVVFGTGDKIQIEDDFVGPHGLSFSRTYSSKMSWTGVWSHTYDKRLTLPKIPHGDGSTISTFSYLWDVGSRRWVSNGGTMAVPQTIYRTEITRSDGYGYYFESRDAGASWHADSNVNLKLSSSQTDTDGNFLQWKLITLSNDTEIYDQEGRLSAIQFADGHTQTLTYSDATTPVDIAPGPGKLIRVADSFGRQLQFRYEPNGRMKLIDPAGNEYVYDFPSDGSNQSSVTYPDGSRRVYSYNEPENVVNGVPNMTYLTGMSDEITPGNLVRYSIYKYNGSLPISTEHVAGANKFSFDYANSTVTDPLGTVRWYEFEKVNGRQMQKRYSQPDGYGSTAANNTAFDDNGNPSVTWDLKGIATIRDFDQVSNLEVSRVEARGTPDARTVQTQWDTTLRKPVAIAAPQLRTTFAYDPAGNMLTRTEQATSDLDGAQGFNATLVGTLRRWTYTYNPMGLLLTTRGPRTDVNDTSTNGYDVAGNLTSITNAMNQVVTLSNYDANGHVGRITDPNGLVTDLVYTPRGWLSSVKRGVETTSYS